MPVQVQEIHEQRDQREPIARKPQQRLDQQRGACLHLIHHGVGKCAGRLARKKSHLCRQHAIKQGLTQHQHTLVGDPCKRVLADKLRHTPYKKDAQNGQRNHPQLQGALGKTFIQQGLQQGGNQRLRHCAYQGRCNGNTPRQPLVAKINRQPPEARNQTGGGDGKRGFFGRGVCVFGLHVARILRLQVGCDSRRSAQCDSQREMRLQNFVGHSLSQGCPRGV
ncbi:hypothetical protein D3C71_1519660 [compost metagenome]